MARMMPPCAARCAPELPCIAASTATVHSTQQCTFGLSLLHHTAGCWRHSFRSVGGDWLCSAPKVSHAASYGASGVATVASSI